MGRYIKIIAICEQSYFIDVLISVFWYILSCRWE